MATTAIHTNMQKNCRVPPKMRSLQTFQKNTTAPPNSNLRQPTPGRQQCLIIKRQQCGRTGCAIIFFEVWFTMTSLSFNFVCHCFGSPPTLFTELRYNFRDFFESFRKKLTLSRSQIVNFKLAANNVHDWPRQVTRLEKSLLSGELRVNLVSGTAQSGACPNQPRPLPLSVQ